MLTNESQFLNLSTVIHYTEIIGSVLEVSTLIQWKTERKNKLEVLKKLLGLLVWTLLPLPLVISPLVPDLFREPHFLWSSKETKS